MKRIYKTLLMLISCALTFLLLFMGLSRENYCFAQSTLLTMSTSNNTNIALSKQYSNAYFSLNYPSSWQIVQDDNQVATSTTIAVQIMEKQTNNTDFRPNINIIVSSKKWSEPTSYIAKQTSQNNRKMIPTYRQIGICDTQIGKCKGSLLEYIFSVNGYTLRGRQYIVKKVDNTIFYITATTDNGKDKTQIKTIKAILNSIKIK